MQCIELASVSNVYSWRRKCVPVLPNGMTVDVNCGNDLCISPQHVITRPKRSHVSPLRPYADKLNMLAMDESFEIPDYANDGESVRTLRCYLQMKCTHYLFLVRSLPQGGVRIIRTGTWGGAKTAIIYPVLKVRQARDTRALRPSAFFLGFLGGQSLHVRDIPRITHCDWKGCIFPAHRKANGVHECLYHTNFWRYPSYLYKGTLDIVDLFARPDSEKGVRQPHFSVTFGQGIEALERSLVFEHRGYRKRRQVERLTLPRKKRRDFLEMIREQSPAELKRSQTKSGKGRSAIRKHGPIGGIHVDRQCEDSITG